MLLTCRLPPHLFSGRILPEKHFFMHSFIYLTTVSASDTIMSNGREVIER